MTIPPKKVINSNPGDADHVGGNDWDDLADWMNNVDKTGPVKINTRTYFRSSKFELRNPSDTFSYVHVAAALAGNININWPLLTSNDEPLFKTFAATVSNKTLDSSCDISAAIGASGAPSTAQYVTLAADAGLSAEQILGVGDGLALTNATITPDLIDRARKRVGFIEDFFGYADATQQLGSVMAGNITGAGASVDSIPVTEAGVFGVWQLTTGTTTTGASGISTGDLSAFSLGQGSATFEALIKIPVLSVVGDEYIFRIGFMDSVTGSPTDGVIFSYDRLTNVNWLKLTKSFGTPTQTATSVPVTTTGWTRMKIVVNAAGTSVEFFINGTSVGTATTNIPVGAGRELTTASSIVKSAGTTPRTAKIDYIAFDYDLTTPR